VNLKTIVLPLFLSIVCVVNAQLSLSGIVLNASDKTPLEYASISILNRPIGTVSNNSGRFVFYFNEKFLNDTLVISSLGYKPFKQVITNLIQLDSIQCELIPTEINLSEFLITSLSANEIVRKAIQLIPKNYPSSPFLLKGFYRHFRNENDQCVDLIEMALLLEDNNYTPPYKVKKESKENYIKRYQHSPVTETIYVEQFRRSFNNQQFYKEYFFNENMIVELLRNNRIKYRNFELDTTITSYYFAGQITDNNQKILIISSEKEGGAKIYIDADTYAIIKLENEVSWMGNYLFQKKVHNYEKALERERSMRITIEFQELNNKMYLKYLNYAWSYEIYSEEKQKTVVVFDVNSLLVINEIITSPTKLDVNDAKKMNKNKRLEDFNYEYHPNFWNKYNLIETNPIDNKVIKDLEENLPLEKQFKKSQVNKK